MQVLSTFVLLYHIPPPGERFLLPSYLYCVSASFPGFFASVSGEESAGGVAILG